MNYTSRSLRFAARLRLLAIVLLPSLSAAQSPGNFSTLTTTGNGTIGGTLSIERGGSSTPGFGLDVWGAVFARGRIVISTDELSDTAPGATLQFGTSFGESYITFVDQYTVGAQGDLLDQYFRFRLVSPFSFQVPGVVTHIHWQWIQENTPDATSYVQAELTNAVFTLYPHQNQPQTQKIELNADLGTIKIAGQPVLTAASLGALPNLQLSNAFNHSIGIGQSANGVGGKHLAIVAGNGGFGSNVSGGNLILSGGMSSGSAGSSIELRTAAAGSSGENGHLPQTRLRINPSGGIEAGDGLAAAGAPQLVVGKFNDTNTNDAGVDHTLGVFVVGTGTGTLTNQRKNAMRILDDGTILIQEKGDLSMGNFKSGPTP